MDDKRFAILLTDAQEVKILECDPQKEMFDIAREAIGCEWIELKEPEPLARDGLVMMIDEEGKLRNGTAYINCIASHLYGSERHGDPIVGHAVIVKAAEESLELLTGAEAKQVAFCMEQGRGHSVDQIAEAFGLRPGHKKDAENAKTTRRQPCKKNNMER